ncbi:hypothetical protein CEXT_475121 [Caerostris extrusa]|uniref:Secreted protein n=1 Tax=Caerostris extrusa TaxID=172846 RepID=A0AAV4NV54_CAEEX|nr:hypothetical protein CEXT_475121 [Caerostris extrusa]
MLTRMLIVTLFRFPIGTNGGIECQRLEESECSAKITILKIHIASNNRTKVGVSTSGSQNTECEYLSPRGCTRRCWASSIFHKRKDLSRAYVQRGLGECSMFTAFKPRWKICK